MKPSLFFPQINNSISKSFMRYHNKSPFSLAKSWQEASYIVHIDPKKIIRLGNNKEVLLQVEPEVVRPDLYWTKAFRTYDYIIPISEERAKRQNLQEWVDLPLEIPTYRKRENQPKKFAALVNEHKFSASSRSKYGLRREVIKLCRSKGIELDLFGKQWGDSKTLVMRRRLYALRTALVAHSPISITECFGDLFYSFQSEGIMDPEGQGLQDYRLSIVIENDLDYVSEKIWKSLYAGSIPIYVGPRLDKFGEMNEVVVECSDNADSILEAIDKTKNIDFLHWRNEVDAFLQSKEIEKRKDPLQFWKKFADVLFSLDS